MRKEPDSGQLPDLPAEPLPSRLEPMLAKAAPLPKDDEEWAFEIKWDGARALGFVKRGSWRMLSRSQEEITGRYPELEDIGGQLGDRSTVLDGEVVAFDEDGHPSFQQLQSRIGLTSPGAVEQRRHQVEVTYIVFDLLHLDGHSTRELPYHQRRRLLEGLELDGPSWQTPRSHPGPGADLFEAVRREGLEGVVAKRRQSTYKPGKRSGDWIKQRVWLEQEFVIGGHIPGEGKRAERVGSLLVGYWDARAEEARRRGEPQRLIFAGGVGSGLSEDQLDFLTRELGKRRRSESPFADCGGARGPKARRAVWCEPELACQVAWTEWTQQGTLRQPVFKGMRDDKDPRDVVRES